MSLASKTGSESLFRLWRYWAALAPLDQGQTPQCVAFSWKGWLRTSPIHTTTGPGTQFIYDECQKVDGWPLPHDGSSVRAGAQIINGLGYIANYVWATTPDELKTWVLTKGPVVVGTIWTKDMFTPDANGTVKPTGSVVGGHAYLITGYSRVSGRYRCLNSWGSGWGKKGSFWIKDSDLYSIIFSNEGEACAAVEQPLAVKVV
jgi:hypothetical protein